MYNVFRLESSDSAKVDTGHQNEWADIEMPNGSVKKCEDSRRPTGHKWVACTLFVPLNRPSAVEVRSSRLKAEAR